MNQDNPINGDNLAKARYTVDNCEKILSVKILQKALSDGLDVNQVDILCKAIRESIEDYKIEKESAMQLINNYDISLWLEDISKKKVA